MSKNGLDDRFRKGVSYMKDFYMYMCDICGFSSDHLSECPRCEMPLTQYSKETQNEYQVNVEDAMRAMSEYKWYL